MPLSLSQWTYYLVYRFSTGHNKYSERLLAELPLQLVRFCVFCDVQAQFLYNQISLAF
jgi:hypothetical protein